MVARAAGRVMRTTALQEGRSAAARKRCLGAAEAAERVLELALVGGALLDRLLDRGALRLRLLDLRLGLVPRRRVGRLGECLLLRLGAGLLVAGVVGVGGELQVAAEARAGVGDDLRRLERLIDILPDRSRRAPYTPGASATRHRRRAASASWPGSAPRRRWRPGSRSASRRCR